MAFAQQSDNLRKASVQKMLRMQKVARNEKKLLEGKKVARNLKSCQKVASNLWTALTPILARNVGFGCPHLFISWFPVFFFLITDWNFNANMQRKVYIQITYSFIQSRCFLLQVVFYVLIFATVQWMTSKAKCWNQRMWAYGKMSAKRRCLILIGMNDMPNETLAFVYKLLMK